ncbi:hypothetical protein C8Q75DRAFT_888034 [Abortiporus biennis]|nr:hypothetical protein C8Q75DRAFT_888034 [Abortiporus biennis]
MAKSTSTQEKDTSKKPAARTLRSHTKRTTIIHKPILLPPEIQDHIVSYLWNKPKSLRACGFANRSWHTAVRPYIFRSLTLNKEGRLKELEFAVENEPVVGSWIREIIIKPDPYILLDGTIWNHIIHPCAWILRLPTILPHKLKRLYSFQFIGLGDMGWKYRELNATLPKFAYFSSVKSLSIINCRIPKELMRATASSFPNLTNLHIINTYPTPNPLGLYNQTQQLVPRHSPRLEELSLHIPDGLLAWELGSFDELTKPPHKVNDLRVLDLRLQHPGGLMDLGSLLKFLGQSLQELSVTIVSDTWATEQQYQAITDHCDLSNLTGLRSITLNPLSHPGNSHFLSTIKSPHIAKVAFLTSFVYLRSLEATMLTKLREVLQEEIFESLEDLQFFYSGPLKVDKVYQKMKREFSGVVSRHSVYLQVIGADDE